MAHVVILGAGLGGVPMAYEMKDHARATRTGSRSSPTATRSSSRPSNPWVAVDWRKPDEIMVPLGPVFERKGSSSSPVAPSAWCPDENRVELADGRDVAYDYLVIATGPELAFDEIAGPRARRRPHPVDLHVHHATRPRRRWEEFAANPGPIVVGAVQGASCFGPAYEYAMILDTELRRRKIRDRVPMTFVTSEPYIGHLGLGGVGDTKGLLESELRERHINWIVNAKVDKVEADKMFVTEFDEDGEEQRKPRAAVRPSR